MSEQSVTRQELETRYRIFDHFALKDQKGYYKHAIEQNRQAGRQISHYRALFAFLTGLCAALAGLIAQTTFVESAPCWSDAVDKPAHCGAVGALATILAILAVVLPAVGTIFSTLADLFQWDKLTSIYSDALENLEVADALSPSENIPVEQVGIYLASVRAFAEGSLNVMRDETAQWGQSIRTPSQIEEFIAAERRKAEQKEEE